jgi:hypothetical protein
LLLKFFQDKSPANKTTTKTKKTKLLNFIYLCKRGTFLHNTKT